MGEAAARQVCGVVLAFIDHRSFIQDTELYQDETYQRYKIVEYPFAKEEMNDILNGI